MIEEVKNLRDGEAFLPSSCSRTRRILKINNKWFFLTRESIDPLGPYETALDAAQAAQEYVEFAAAGGKKMALKYYEYLSNAG